VHFTVTVLTAVFQVPIGNSLQLNKINFGHHGFVAELHLSVFAFLSISAKATSCGFPGLRFKTDVNCAFLGYYVAISGNFLQIGCTETSVRNYYYSLRNNPVSGNFLQIGCTETSVRNYYYSLRNNPVSGKFLQIGCPETSVGNYYYSLRNNPVSGKFLDRLSRNVRGKLLLLAAY